ncbi:membrane-bound serine protease (ClpP class) [Tumebacillus sp. BK434]|uniref:NfeD family protein n=1 Tax=Tumebacillus sp. BK434 TaxID=2512169 RepID=UPI0010450124|nr:nodulation protein NfeD [Tumebacillus sp. BK434]TCP53316.1 membrane-bound serine protease (ClpP class) [Tumebacillus sp. BK434]
MKRRFRCLIICLLMLLPFAGLSAPDAKAAAEGSVFVIPVENEIETGLTASLRRAFSLAEEEQARAIVLDIDTLGGRVDAAMEIGELIRSTEIPVIAFVQSKAISAGSYIAINAPQLAMAPGATIGAAEVRQSDGEQADPKVVAFWRAEMIAAAEHTGRDTKIVSGMVDRNVEIPGVKAKGELVSLSAEQAVAHKLVDGIFPDLKAALVHYGYGDVAMHVYQPTLSEQIGRFVTQPLVIPLLLVIGLMGLTWEIVVPGKLFPGVIGGASLALYFWGHMAAGFAGWESVILFAAGLVLMIAEIFVAGFGIVGALGVIALGSGVVLAAHDTSYGLKAMLLAIILSVVLGAVLFKYFGHLGMWKKIILTDQQEKADGYVPAKSNRHMLYQTGRTVTPLRPSGTAVFQGQRFDVVSEGSWLPVDAEVQIVLIEGTRIVVRPASGESNKVIPVLQDEEKEQK